MILAEARYEPSPNASSREGCAVDAVVIHHLSLPPGEFGGPYVVDFFLNRLDPEIHPYFRQIADLRVSAHFFVDRGGGLVQFVDTDRKAWHAGESSLAGVPNVNRFSIGVELEGDEITPYADAQYERLAGLIRTLRRAHPGITLDRIVGHEDVAPGRKKDPGPLFDWARLRRALGEGGGAGTQK